LSQKTGRAIVGEPDLTSFYHFVHAVSDLNGDGINEILVQSKASSIGDTEDKVFVVSGQ